MILKYPYPYQAWLSVANDPDNTLIKDWHELNQVMWEELKLPLGNSLFVKSFNANIPEQVNLVDNPEISSQHHDIIHTWGDYMHSRSKGFDREDAIEALDILRQHNIKPKVWIDHASFPGNLMHNSSLGAIPAKNDQSGYTYTNYQYTLDIIQQLGIRYIWNGDVTNFIGQDRKLKASEYFSITSRNKPIALLKTLLSSFLSNTRLGKKFRLTIPSNQQYYPHKFPDGSKLYCFVRYGTWKDADIYGLYNVIEPAKIDSLIKNNGTAVVYTHLGKRPHDKLGENFHIPKNTREALSNLSVKYNEKQLMISPLADMLDYLVIRDNMRFDEKNSTIHFKADGISFEKLTSNELKGKKFSFKSGVDTSQLKVLADGKPLDYELIKENDDIFSIVLR